MIKYSISFDPVISKIIIFLNIPLMQYLATQTKLKKIEDIQTNYNQ